MLRFSFFVSVLTLALGDVRGDFVLQPNDSIAICGDSITEQKIYSVFLEDYLLMCQPTPGQLFVQDGISGEQLDHFLGRLDRDVFPFKPTVATTNYGMNDGGYSEPKPEITERFRKNQTAVVEALKERGVRVIVVGSPKCVDTFSFHNFGRSALSPVAYNQTLSSLAEAARDVAHKESVLYADVFGATTTAMEKSKAVYGENYPFGGPDGVHPGPNGHLVMAYAYLKALGCDGDIGTITVHYGLNQAAGSPGQTIVSTNGGTIKIESTRYPFCFHGEPDKPSSDTASILKMVPFNEELNRYMLIVDGLDADKADVTWGTKTKQFTADQLKAGINLAAEFIQNPFTDAFDKVDAAVRAQQAFETPLIENQLYDLPDLEKKSPDRTHSLEDAAADAIKKSRDLSQAAAALVVPVDYTLTIEPSH